MNYRLLIRKMYVVGGFCIMMLFFVTSKLFAQDIDFENIGKRTKEMLKKNPFKISGGINANAIFYHSNLNNSRSPFTYFLNGNLNIGIYQWSMPISYSLTNQGSNLGYKIPWNFNRVSVNPKYKWIQAHLGDASMSFSPYTYNGLLFTGAGVELSPPQIPLKIAAFGGRLNKVVKDGGNPNTIPSFFRMGYGMQIKWEKEKYKLGLIGFYAKDKVNSLDSVSVSKNVFPQENLVVSANASALIIKKIELFAEYSNSGLTQDLRALPEKNYTYPTGLFFRTRTSTSFFNAYNGGINILFKIGTIGLKYEHIDPGYQTLGAYYFNNDLESYTANTALNLFKSKLSIAANLGLQRDNLNAVKEKSTFRWVGSLNANFKATENLLIATTYSNFSMYTNKQLNQFTNINQNPLQIQQPQDSINYKQIAQNFNININYAISNSKTLSQNMNINYSLNDMINRENNIIRKGGISRFHNANISYALGFPEIKLSIATSVNYTNIYAASQFSNIVGPSVSVNKTFFKDLLQTSLSISYNYSNATNVKNNIANIVLSASYTAWKKHNFNANIVQLFRSSNPATQPNLSELTATIGYSFSF